MRRLREVGRRLTEDFLAGPVGAALAAQVAEATGLNEVLELGLEVAGQPLTDLPWEALQVPEASGEIAEAGGSPLVLHRNVAAYRLIGGLGTAPAYRVRGPLRLLVAIASPETADAELLDYEAELARIVAAVEPARRRGEAYVRVLNEGSLAAISAALTEDPEGFHVLHLSCHARPGELLLETAGGQPDLVTAQRLLEEGVPAGADLPMVVLSGCSTGLAARQERLHPDGRPGRAAGFWRPAAEAGRPGRVRVRRCWPASPPSWCGAGVPQVLAMQAPVTDPYATALSAGVLPAAGHRRLPGPAAGPGRGAAGGRTGPAGAAARLAAARPGRMGHPGADRPGAAAAAVQPARAVGTGAPAAGPGAGRGRGGPGGRGLRRAAGRDAPGPPRAGRDRGGAGAARHRRGRQVHPGRRGAAVPGRATPGWWSPRPGRSRWMTCSARSGPGCTWRRRRPRAARAWPGRACTLRAADVEWADRWRLLAEQILPAVPMIVLLDNFEDNLQEADDGGWQVRDPELAAFLAGWARRPGQSRLVFTCRYPFSLPGRAERRLAGLHLGPLSAAETSKLMWRLPGLDALPAAGQGPGLPRRRRAPAHPGIPRCAAARRAGPLRGRRRADGGPAAGPRHRRPGRLAGPAGPGPGRQPGRGHHPVGRRRRAVRAAGASVGHPGGHRAGDRGVGLPGPGR